jgi:hypothetical protein
VVFTVSSQRRALESTLAVEQQDAPRPAARLPEDVMSKSSGVGVLALALLVGSIGGVATSTLMIDPDPPAAPPAAQWSAALDAANEELARARRQLARSTRRRHRADESAPARRPSQRGSVAGTAASADPPHVPVSPLVAAEPFPEPPGGHAVRWAEDRPFAADSEQSPREQLTALMERRHARRELMRLPRAERWQRLQVNLGLNTGQLEAIRRAFELRDAALRAAEFELELTSPRGRPLRVKRRDPELAEVAENTLRRSVGELLDSEQRRTWALGGLEHAFGRDAPEPPPVPEFAAR